MVAILKNSWAYRIKAFLSFCPKKMMPCLSARNIPGVKLTRVADLNTYEVAAYNMLLITKDAAVEIRGNQEDHEKYFYRHQETAFTEKGGSS